MTLCYMTSDVWMNVGYGQAGQVSNFRCKIKITTLHYFGQETLYIRSIYIRSDVLEMLTNMNTIISYYEGVEDSQFSDMCIMDNRNDQNIKYIWVILDQI